MEMDGDGLWLISIHALREEGDDFLNDTLNSFNNFYPRPPRGGRLNANIASGFAGVFLSTPSARRATFPLPPPHPGGDNFYPRPPRGGRHVPYHQGDGRHRISIHALREEGDLCQRRFDRRQRNFYPRPPRGGRRRRSKTNTAIGKFLSTPSARRATTADIQKIVYIKISIHALREEGDPGIPRSDLTGTTTLSTPKLRLRAISIHALREEGDAPPASDP